MLFPDEFTEFRRDASELLEDGLADRLRVRVEAFKALHPDGPHHGCSGEKCSSARAMLEALSEVTK